MFDFRSELKAEKNAEKRTSETLVLGCPLNLNVNIK